MSNRSVVSFVVSAAFTRAQGEGSSRSQGTDYRSRIKGRQLTEKLWNTSSAAVASDGQHDVAYLATCLDIPSRLNDLLQWVGPIDHGSVLARLDQLIEDEQIRLRIARDPHDHPHVADPAGHERGDAEQCVGNLGGLWWARWDS